MPTLGGWEIVIILGVLVLLFGARRLPDMARSIGQSARVFRGEMRGMKDDAPAEDKTAAPAQPQQPAAQQLPPTTAPVAAPVAAPTTGAAPVTDPAPATTPQQAEPTRTAGPGSASAGQ